MNRLASKLRTRPNAAIILMECMVYIAVLAVVLGLAMTAFYQAWNNHRDLDRVARDILQALRAGEQWRDDVRHASGPPTLTVSTNGHAFFIPHPQGEVIYLFQSNAVWRAAAQQSNRVQVLERFKFSRLEMDRRTRVHAWRWELELPSRRQEVRTVPLFTFLAATPAAVPAPPP